MIYAFVQFVQKPGLYPRNLFQAFHIQPFRIFLWGEIQSMQSSSGMDPQLWYPIIAHQIAKLIVNCNHYNVRPPSYKLVYKPQLL